MSQGKLDVYEKVSAYLPDFKDQPPDRFKGKDNIRVIDVLQHQSGLPSSFYFYTPEKAGMYYSQEREKTIEYLMKIPLDYETGTKHVYSDIGYMLLGCIVEKLTGKPLDVYTEQELYKPLKLKHTLYNPLQKGFKAKQFAATERMGNTRDGVIHFLISAQTRCKEKYMTKKPSIRWKAFRATPDCFQTLMIWRFCFKSC